MLLLDEVDVLVGLDVLGFPTLLDVRSVFEDVLRTLLYDDLNFM